MPKEQDLYRKCLSLVGKNIELGISSTGEQLFATITNAMFDSILISINGVNRVVAFRDLAYLDEK